MKTIDPLYTAVNRVLCPFCSFGCEFGIVFNDFGIKGVEYIKEGNSEGRLCPRGSGAAFYLNHPRRLTMPLKNGKAVDWSKMVKELKKVVGRPKDAAITFDRNLTIEEYNLLVSFCREVGIENIASTYLEPERFLRGFFKEPFSTEEINNAKMIVVVGDLFNQTPMISKTLINWKLSNRRNRLIVIDSINTHTAVFANDFVKTKVGAEPILLLEFAQENSETVDISEFSSISKKKALEMSRSFKETESGIIIACLPFAHTYDSHLLTEALSRFSSFSGKKVVPFVEYMGFDGNQHFGSVMSSIKKRKIKYLINFGEIFPFYYPQIVKGLKGLNLYSTSTLKYDGYTAIPAALNLEKEGSIMTTFGRRNLTGNIKPASGAKTVAEIINSIQETSADERSLQAPAVKIDVKERIEKVVDKCRAARKKKNYLLIGEKIAFSFLGLFEKEMIRINPHDAKELGIKPNDRVSIKSKQGEVELRAKLTDDVGRGITSVPAEIPEVKGLFDFEIVNDIISFTPTEVEIWRKG